MVYILEGHVEDVLDQVCLQRIQLVLEQFLCLANSKRERDREITRILLLFNYYACTLIPTYIHLLLRDVSLHVLVPMVNQKIFCNASPPSQW